MAALQHPSNTPRHWLQEIVAGAVGTAATLAVPLTLGLLAFAALGAQAAVIGIPAALATTVVGGVLYGLVGRTAMPAAGPSSATALILASLVLGLVQDPQLRADGVVACAALAVVLSGLLQMLMAALGLARLARFVPQPVLAGFMNGVALLIALGQLPLLLGQGAGTPLLAALAGWQPLALLLGGGTAALALLAGRRWPRVPTALLALLLGTLLHQLALHLLPGAPLGRVVGPLPDGLPGPLALLPLAGPGGQALLQQHGAAVGVTAVVLALVGALESALNSLAVDQARGTRHEPARELLAIGLANAVCGLFGSLPLVALRARAMAMLMAGGRSALAAVGGSLVLALLVLTGGHWLAALPLPVLAGIMLVVALGLLDRWTHGLLQRWWAGERSREMRLSLALVAVVCGVTLWQGFVVAVAVGVLLSMVLFIARMNRSLVRSRSTAAARPSRRVWPAALEQQLQPLRAQVLVLELEGALFFGSGDRLLSEAEALGGACRCVVLGLQHVGSIDETGVVALQQLQTLLWRDGIVLRVAGVDVDSPRGRVLAAFGAPGAAIEFWPDIDRAVEAAERDLLGGAAAAALAPVALEDCLLLQGLDAAERAQVAARMPAQRLQPGEMLFHEGDAADRLYVLVAGSLSVVSAPRAGVGQQRFLSLSPGMMLGETAMLDGQGRSAAAVADGEAVVHVLTRADLEALHDTQPALASRLHRNIALHLSQRLRSAAAAWHASTR